MKNFRTMMVAVMAMLALTMTSCLNSSDDDSTSTLGTIASVKYTMGYLTFTNGSLTYIPSATSVAALEAKGATFDKYDVVYITYTSTENYDANKTQYNIELTGLVVLDNDVHTVANKEVLNDSINKTNMEPILELYNWSTSASQYMVMMDKSNVLVYVNYFMNKNAHYITLKYCPAETDESSDGLNLYLCNNGNGDKSTSYTSAGILNSNGYSYGSLCYRAFNITFPLLDFENKTGKTSFKINIITQQNSVGVDMAGSEPKTYSYDYDATKF